MILRYCKVAWFDAFFCWTSGVFSMSYSCSFSVDVLMFVLVYELLLVVWWTPPKDP